MSKLKKSKLDQFAEVLAQMDAETKTLAEMCAWLKAEGCSVSPSRLSEFLEVLRTRRSLQDTNDLIETFEEFTKKQNPDWSADKVRDVGIQFFMAHATAKKDADKFATIVKLDQNERFGKTKASQDERRLTLDQRKFQRETCELFIKWAADKRAMEIAAGGASHSEKLQRLDQLMFPDDHK